jgi:16S rRNA (guanine527-N7)-methyltransferase
MTLRSVSQSVEVGGQVVFMKGPNAGPETKAAAEKWKEFHELEADTPYELPKTPHQRRLIVFRKIKTPPPPEDRDDDL